MTAAERAMTPAEPKSEALRALYWRDEILQVMFWLRGEGFGDDADAPLIERFLGVDANIGIGYLDRLVEEGYLIGDAAHYRLTEQGIDQGGRIFSEEFAEFMRPTHGECGPDCRGLPGGPASPRGSRTLLTSILVPEVFPRPHSPSASDRKPRRW